jgi:hypothetical protein
MYECLLCGLNLSHTQKECKVEIVRIQRIAEDIILDIRNEGPYD